MRRNSQFIQLLARRPRARGLLASLLLPLGAALSAPACGAAGAEEDPAASSPGGSAGAGPIDLGGGAGGSEAPKGSLCDVDILFVYDTSGSMMDAVGPLTGAAFPAFSNALASYPDLGAVHVAVTTNLWGERSFQPDRDSQAETSVQTSTFLTKGWDPATPHDGFWCEELPSVDCQFTSGKTWIEGTSGTASATTMQEEFACVGNVPCQQDVNAGEPTLEAGLKALQHETNAGFLRKEALLVVVYITDEEDQSAMTNQSIRDGLLALKGGDSRYVSVTTIAGPEVGAVEVNPKTHKRGCKGKYGGTEQTPSIIEFTRLFGDQGRHYEMCGTNDLSGALAAALDVLELGCERIDIR